MTSHYLEQCWIIFHWALKNNFRWHLNQIQQRGSRKMHLRISSAHGQSFYLDPDMLPRHTCCDRMSYPLLNFLLHRYLELYLPIRDSFHKLIVAHTERGMSFWQNLHHWLHRTLPKWKTFGAASDENFVKMTTFSFQFSDAIWHRNTGTALLITYEVRSHCRMQHWFIDLGSIPDSKVHGTNMGPILGRQDPGGPHFGPMNFAIWDIISVKLE